MYAAYYGLEEPPFNITPDPRFLYLNDSYQEALAALAYGIEGRKGFISLIGEAGTGKTTLLRRLLDTLNANVKTVLLLNPTVSFDEILEYILLELGIPSDVTGKLGRLHRLNEFLIEHARAGGNVALLIDEAQDLDPSVLEELRLLSNLETAREKILQIVLAGQPELDAKLANPALRQFRQRITLHVRLHPLSPDDVGAYVRTRLERAGARDPELFTTPAVERVAIVTRGIPRIVNVVCDAALLTAYATGAKQVTPTVVEEVWREYAPPGDEALEPGCAPAPPTNASAAVPSQPSVADAIRPSASPAPTTTPATAESPTVPPPPAPRDTTAEPAAKHDSAASDQRTTDSKASAPSAVSEPAPVAPAPASEPTPIVSITATDSEPRVPGRASRRADGGQKASRSTRAATEELPAAGGSVTVRHTLSIPTAAAFVALLALVLYGLALNHRDDVPPPLAAAVTTPGADPAPVDAAPAAPRLPLREAPVSTEDAAALVEEFRAAYQARDVARLLTLFAPDASENGTRGIEAIEAAYRRTFGTLEDLRYRLPSISIAPRGTSTEVRAPFVISYRETTGDRRELHGEAEWEVERRDGRPLISALNYRLDPES